jgi:hypothetical protein
MALVSIIPTITFPRLLSAPNFLFSRATKRIGSPIILGRYPSLSAHESESMLRTYLVCREKQEKEKEKQTARGKSTQYTNNSDTITSTS